MAKIILACNKNPLAAFIKTELAACGLDCRIAGDTTQLQALVAEFKPEVLFFDSAFSSFAESSGLINELLGANQQFPVIGIFEPFAENEDVVKQLFSPESILILPFSGDDLLEKLNQSTGLEIIKKSVERELEEDKEMPESQVVPVEKVELTEIVEEGLPLDEISGLDDSKASEFLLKLGSDDEDSSEVEVEPDAEPEAESGAEIEPELEADFLDDFDLDGEDFDDTLDGLGSALGGNLKDGGSGLAVDKGSEVAPENVLASGDAGAEDSSDLVPGDIDGLLSDDALLSDDDFAEVELPRKPETFDPVLDELKSAGLMPEHEVEASQGEGTSLSVEDDLAESQPEADFESLESSPEEVVGREDKVDFTEMVIPESITDSEAAEEAEPELEMATAVEDHILQMNSEELSGEPKPEAAHSGLGGSVSETFTTPSEIDPELPEDYLLDEEMPESSAEPEAPEIESEAEVESAPEFKKEPEAKAPILASSASSTPETGEPEICAEPHSPDFSRQIENMTQEWSKQLLQSTYASMDKMIKAIGDLAPTIVDQVAREVIPPLAEKVIKAEISRLEKTLEIEEESGEIDEG